MSSRPSTMVPPPGVSRSAYEREEEAKDIFLAAKKEFDQTLLPTMTTVGETHTIQLLQPNLHLTSRTYSTFHRWIKENHAGWNVKRREATQEECMTMNVNNICRAGKSYWVDVIYRVSDPNKKPRKANAAKNFEASRDIGEDAIPATKKQKVVLFDFGRLGPELQMQVLSFLDVPELGACVRVSKALNELAKHDSMWRGHLQLLLKGLFDDAFGNIDDHVYALVLGGRVAGNPDTSEAIERQKISERPQRSTEFRTWLSENASWGRTIFIRKYSVGSICEDFLLQNTAIFVDDFARRFSRYNWLFQDVSIREYYKQAGGWAFHGKREHERECEVVGRCPACFEEWHCDCPQCHNCASKRSCSLYLYRYANLPTIPLFTRGL